MWKNSCCPNTEIPKVYSANQKTLYSEGLTGNKSLGNSRNLIICLSPSRAVVDISSSSNASIRVGIISSIACNPALYISKVDE